VSCFDPVRRRHSFAILSSCGHLVALCSGDLP
jgi:hypothetical protein